MSDEELDLLTEDELEERRRRDAKKKAHITEQQDKEALQFIMSHASGRRFIYRWLGICGLYRSSFTGDNATFFNEGRRDIGCQLLAEVVDTDPDMYLTMLKEQNQGAQK